MRLCTLACLRKRLFHTLVCLFILCALLNTSHELRADVRSVGKNNYGQLGDGTLIDSVLPVRPIGSTDIIAVSSGPYFCLAVKSDGTVWAWGWNSNYQLGNNTITYSSTPIQVIGLTDVVEVQAGWYHCLALKADGTVWAWGNNGHGQIGDGTTQGRFRPVQVSNLSNVVALRASVLSSIALKSDGTVWTWGDNSTGQIGDGTTIDRLIPINIGLTGITAIASKTVHCLALKSDGTVWAWGGNGVGQLGDNTQTTRSSPVQVQGLTNVSAISCGTYTSYALKSDRSVWGWGANVDGALGLGSNANLQPHTPIQIPSFSNVIKIMSGYKTFFALKDDGPLWACGTNNYGQLGLGIRTNAPDVPRQVFNAVSVNSVASGDFHTLFLTNPSGTLNLEGGIPPTALPQPFTFLFHPTDNSGDFVRTADVPPVGDFVLPDVPANTYTVHIKGTKYLAKNVTLTTTGAIRNLTATLKTGDANDDNATDIADLLLLIGNYNTLGD